MEVRHMKLLLIFLGSLLLSACSNEMKEYSFLYSFHTIDYGHSINARDDIMFTIEEEDEVYSHSELNDLELKFNVTNQSGADLEVGGHLEIERWEKDAWVVVETPEEYAEDSILITIPDGNQMEYVISIDQRFLQEDELTGGTYRINNNDAFYAYFVVSEFSTEY